MVLKLQYKIALAILLVCCLSSVSLVKAKMAVQTQLVSGKITALTEGVIELDVYEKFYPVRADMEVSAEPGNEVTIRYVATPDGTKKYLEIAKGRNSLSPRTMPSGDSETKTFK